MSRADCHYIQNIEIISSVGNQTITDIITERSQNAALTIMGFRDEKSRSLEVMYLLLMMNLVIFCLSMLQFQRNKIAVLSPVLNSLKNSGSRVFLLVFDEVFGYFQHIQNSF